MDFLELSNHQLYAACAKGELESVKVLLATVGIQINEGGIGGRTPLMGASGGGHLKVVQLLLTRKEILINQATTTHNNGATPL